MEFVMRLKIFINLGVLTLLLAMPFHAAAKSPEAGLQTLESVMINVVEGRSIFSFGDLGYRAADLLSPVASTRVRFSVPPGLRLVSGGEIELHYDLLITGADSGNLVNSSNPYAGNLIISFNGKIIGTVNLEKTGSNTVRLQIPDDALVSTEQDGSYLLTISLSAQFSCVSDINTMITIKPTSFFDLPFETSAPELDLSNLPAPFYLNNSFAPDRTLVVLPDDPEALVVEAALDVMAGFGSMIDDVYDINLVTRAQLSQADLDSSHMVFVGLPVQLDILSNINFPIAVANGQFVNALPDAAEDGIVQLAVSPWNPNKVLMMVSGNSGAAVVKAAQAVSAGGVFVFENPAIAYVSSVQSISDAIPVVEGFTFQNLGYLTNTLSGIGVFSTEYMFKVSKEQVSGNDGYIDLVYYHSGSLSYGSSTMSVDLNGLLITSAVFKEETEQVATLRIAFPPGALRFGENQLRITASMPYSQSCDSSGLSSPWLIVSDQSLIHLPSVVEGGPSVPLQLDLSFYPDLFTTHSDLGDVTFVLPKSDVTSLRIAGALAYNLGDAANSRITSLKAVYADNVPQDVRDKQSMIVVGRSSTLPFLSEINDSLPAPFDVSTDTASERQMQIIYRIPEGVSVGYLELIASPFNADKSILVVSGNNESGLLMAGSVPIENDLANQLAGTFAVTNGKQVATGNGSSLSSIVGQVVPNAETIVSTPIPTSVTGESVTAGPPAWLMPVLVGSGLIIVVVMGFMIRSAILRSRPQNSEDDIEESDD
ncbi:MAG: cellulose biosynthesis cyclic di-GMP-binding regulatory protein BcsB [Candidatus Doudnabacteria bacterium]|nr:cellulose biosynthesis cyclic di-GMP-binding regulatory protein BcsB [Candidatus Doudnabacteria bacterium]